MKRWVIATLLLLAVACAPKQAVTVEQPRPAAEAPSAPAAPAVTAKSEFKLIQEVAKKSPPTVFGIVKNVGNTTGSVKVTARIYYAKVIVDEQSQVIENVAPGMEANFSITMSKTAQWNSYKVFLE